jgi:hypothetical protein
MKRLTRVTLFALLMLAVAVAAWQGISLLSGAGQALAPVTGQYYVGVSWMAPAASTPSPTPTADLTPRPTAAATAAATTTPPPAPRPTATPGPTPADASGDAAAQPAPTPDPFLVEVASGPCHRPGRRLRDRQPERPAHDHRPAGPRAAHHAASAPATPIAAGIRRPGRAVSASTGAPSPPTALQPTKRGICSRPAARF